MTGTDGRHRAVVPADDIGAFVGTPSLLAEGPPGGPLTGTTVGVKDLFDVAGTVTGAGNPTFAAGRTPAAAHAVAVARLVDAGAAVVGKTVTDELAYSLAGTNVHHGTPVNRAAPGRTPGGSSAGSAAAVAAGLVDLGLGTDTGGSIRVPASYTGTWGWRPTHGAVPMGGVVPLAPSFDTAGLLACDPALLARAAGVLLGEPEPAPPVAPRLLVPAELLAEVADPVAARLLELVDALGGDVAPIDLGVDLGRAMAAFRTLQGAEAWQAHGAWIGAARPTFGRGIAGRFAAASKVTDAEVADARLLRRRVRAAATAATADGCVLVVPAAASAAPRLTADPAGHDAHRQRTLRLTCLAGLAGCPVVVAPVLTDEGLPLGVAFVGAPGTDRSLLAWAATALPR